MGEHDDSPHHPPSTSDLMAILIRMTNERASDRLLLTTLKESYDRRKSDAAKFETDMRTQVGGMRLKVDNNTRKIEQLHNDVASMKPDVSKIGQLQRDVAGMRPAVRRWQTRELVRRGLTRCIGRSWGRFVAAVVAVGAFAAWLADHWPKVGAFLRRMVGQ